MLAETLLGLHGELQQLSGISQEPDLQSMLRWPGVLEEQAPDSESLHAAALELLEEAAQSLQSARAREGEQMAIAIRERLSGIESSVSQVREWLPEIREALRDKQLGRIADLELQQDLDPGRLEQEVAFLAQKMDVDEELDRLAAHISVLGGLSSTGPCAFLERISRGSVSAHEGKART